MDDLGRRGAREQAGRSVASHRRKPLRRRLRAAVLGRNLGRKGTSVAGRNRRQQDAVLQLADLPESLQQAPYIGLAAAELTWHEGQERDSDHVADPSRPRLNRVSASVPTTFPWRRPRYELLLLVLVGVVAFVPVNGVNDQDLSRFCLSQALVHGHLSNDTCLAPSFDKAFFGGHLYSDKAPGMAVVAIPAVEALRLEPLDQIHGSDLRLWGVGC